MNPFDLTDMRILVTGAAGGIGGAAAILASAQGARLVLADMAGRDRVEARVGSLPSIDEIVSFDSSDRAVVEATIAAIGPIDALIDTAAIYTHLDWMDDGFDAALDDIVRVNIKGVINLTRAVFPLMVERGKGRIALCGSIAGWTGGVMSGPHYAFSKGGLHAFIRWLSRRGVPHGVLVNGVAPSTTNTALVPKGAYDPDAFPMRRIAEPEEIAAALVFLCSPGASYLSGTIVDVNGGLHLR